MNASRKWMLCLMLLAGMSISGCTMVQKGAAIGAGAGALVGGFWACNGGELSIAEGALVGAASGGLLGALAGDALGEDMDRDQLLAEIADLQKRLDEKERQLKAAQDENGLLKAEIARLKGELDAANARIKEQDDEIARLKRELAAAAGKKGIARYDIAGAVLFNTGSADLTAGGTKKLDELAKEINSKFKGHELSVEGHTDVQPVKNSSWKSNWDLGAARAVSVLRYLVDKHGFKAGNISATTYGEFRPEKKGATPADLAANRRATIVVMAKEE